MWRQAVAEGKIKPEESFVRADVGRGLSNFSKEELDAWCVKANKAFFLSPKYVINQFILQLLFRRNFRLFKMGLHAFLEEEENVLNRP